MGILMIRCPRTGRPISTGRNADAATFRSSPVFFSQAYCPHCDATHEWFAADAWVCESKDPECQLGPQEGTSVFGL